MYRAVKMFQAILWVIMIVFVPATAVQAEEVGSDAVIARVNGVGLTEGQIERVLDEMIPRAFFHGNITRDKRAEYRPKAFEELIKRELYYQEAKRTGIEVTAADIDKTVKEIEEGYKPQGGLEKVMKAGGFTMETLRKAIARDLTINRFAEREISAKAKVSDEFLRQYYEQHKAEFLRPEAVRLRMVSIFVDPAATKEERAEKKKHAEEILAKSKAGEDFADLAAKYSNDDWRVKGGDFGIRHRGQFDPEIEKAAFALKPGEISGLVETIYGYHFIKLEERLPRTQLSFEEMKDKLRKKLEDDRTKELAESLLKRLKENAKIEIVAEMNKPAVPAQNGAK
ncbi:MAG: peptidylprolyl isomerase [Nitrospiraceae bacterium]|nr:peptidylprolyl isomerase [Nitrospiraceae bacterium]